MNRENFALYLIEVQRNVCVTHYQNYLGQLSVNCIGGTPRVRILKISELYVAGTVSAIYITMIWRMSYQLPKLSDISKSFVFQCLWVSLVTCFRPESGWFSSMIWGSLRSIPQVLFQDPMKEDGATVEQQLPAPAVLVVVTETQDMSLTVQASLKLLLVSCLLTPHWLKHITDLSYSQSMSYIKVG